MRGVGVLLLAMATVRAAYSSPARLYAVASWS